MKKLILCIMLVCVVGLAWGEEVKRDWCPVCGSEEKVAYYLEGFVIKTTIPEVMKAYVCEKCNNIYAIKTKEKAE